MAGRNRDRLSFAAVLAGGSCIAVVAVMLTVVLRTPALPKPRTVTADIYEVPSTGTLRAQPRRDNDRIPLTSDARS